MELVIATANLMEAEGRALRRAVLHTGLQLFGLAGAVVLALAGVCFFLWAAYLDLSVALGPSMAAVVLGAIVIILAGLLTWLSIRISR